MKAQWKGEKSYRSRASEWTSTVEIKASARVFYVQWWDACGCGRPEAHGCHRRGWHVEVTRNGKEATRGPLASRKEAQREAEKLMFAEPLRGRKAP